MLQKTFCCCQNPLLGMPELALISQRALQTFLYWTAENLHILYGFLLEHRLCFACSRRHSFQGCIFNAISAAIAERFPQKNQGCSRAPTVPHGQNGCQTGQLVPKKDASCRPKNGRIRWGVACGGYQVRCYIYVGVSYLACWLQEQIRS